VSLTIRYQVEKKPIPEDPAVASGSGLGRKLSRKQEKAPEGQDPRDTSIGAGEPAIPAASVTSPAKDAVATADGEMGEPGPAPPETVETEANAPAPATTNGVGSGNGSTSEGLMSKFKELIVT